MLITFNLRSLKHPILVTNNHKYMRKIKLGIAFVSVLLLFSNCNDETFENPQEVSATTKLLSGIKEENISLGEIEKDYYLSPILQKTSKKLKQNANNLKNTTQNSFNLDLSNRVKKYTLNDYTSYTIPIINDSGNSYIFQNLVIEKDALRDAAYLVTYYPDENYKESIRKHLVKPDDNIDFTGSKTIEYLYYKRKVNINEKTTTTNKNNGTIEIGSDGVIDEPLTICVTTYSPKQCTAGGNHSPGQPCTGTSGQQPGWIVSESCTPIPRPTDPGPGPYPGGCTDCVTAPSTPNQGTGAYFPPTSPSPDWTPEFICIEQGSGGECTKMVPYTPILTIPMYDPYNYYTTVLSHEEIDLLLRVEYKEAQKSIDFYIERNKTLEGGYVPETLTFVPWALDYFKNNPNTTFEQFNNWFMSVSEGQDWNYDAAYWENPNLTFPKQDLPSYNDYYNGMARSTDGKLMVGADNVYGLIGGKVQEVRNAYPRRTENTCAAKVSIALNRSGIVIPNLPGKTIEGGGTEFTGKYFFLNARELNTWMRKTFETNPSNPNHISYLGSEGGTNGANFPELLKDIKGIYSMVTTMDYSEKTGMSGHSDLMFTDSSNLGNCVYGCFFERPIERIDVWILN